MPSVLIAGGGLVGSANACLFAQKGWNVRVLESREDPRGKLLEPGKSINLALGFRAMETLERIGVKEAVIAVGVPVTKRRLYREGGGGEVEKLPVIRDGDFVLTVSRKKLGDLLISEAEKFPTVKFNFGWKTVGFNLNTQQLISSSPSGEEVSLDADLILACDGAHSSIRRSLLKVPRFNFEQKFIGFGYMDLSLSAVQSDLELGVHNTWMRAGFIIVALVNRDFSLTVSVFGKFEDFERNLSDSEGRIEFFKQNFPELLAILGEKHISSSFSRNKPQAIISVRCSQHSFFDKLVLMGDAAHAMVPFSGQGVNCGLEDCLVLQEMLEEHGNLREAARKYSKKRTEDANAMNEMAWKGNMALENMVYNRKSGYIGMVQNCFKAYIHRFLDSPHLLTTFSRMPYSQISELLDQQQKTVDNLFITVLVVFIMQAFLVFVYFLF